MACLFKNRYYRRCQGDTWWWIRYKDLDGRDRRERAAPTKREAEKILALRVAAVAEGKKLPAQRDGSELFSDFSRQYMEDIGGRLAWSDTLAGTLKLWEEHFGAECRLRDITARRIEAFRSKRRNASLQASTVNRNVAVLKRLLNVAVDWDLLRENPVRKVKQYREENQRLRFLTEEEAGRLVEECGRTRNPLLRPLVELALNTGARRSELLNLRWEDISFEAKTISFVRTKNGTRRDLPMNREALAVLRGLQRRSDGEHVFSRNGRQLQFPRKPWTTALRRAGIEDFRFHDCRHVYASWAAQAGMDVRKLKRLLGHKTLAMTERYSHLSPQDLREAVAMVGIGDRE